MGRVPPLGDGWLQETRKVKIILQPKTAKMKARAKIQVRTNLRNLKTEYPLFNFKHKLTSLL